jgi:hypothetical protein
VIATEFPDIDRAMILHGPVRDPLEVILEGCSFCLIKRKLSSRWWSLVTQELRALMGKLMWSIIVNCGNQHLIFRRKFQMDQFLR